MLFLQYLKQLVTFIWEFIQLRVSWYLYLIVILLHWEKKVQFFFIFWLKIPVRNVICYKISVLANDYCCSRKKHEKTKIDSILMRRPDDGDHNDRDITRFGVHSLIFDTDLGDILHEILFIAKIDPWDHENVDNSIMILRNLLLSRGNRYFLLTFLGTHRHCTVWTF